MHFLHTYTSVTTGYLNLYIHHKLTQKSQLDAVVTRREQQKATTHCGSEFENQIF